MSKNKFSDGHVLVISNLISHVIVLLFLESLRHYGRSEDGAAKASGRDSQEQLQVMNIEKHFLTKWRGGELEKLMFVTLENLGQPDRYEECVEELCGHESGCPEQSHA